MRYYSQNVKETNLQAGADRVPAHLMPAQFPRIFLTGNPVNKAICSLSLPAGPHIGYSQSSDGCEEEARIRRLVAAISGRLARSLVQILVFLGVLALYLSLGVALWRVLDWYIDPSSAADPPTAKKDLFQALGLMMAGVAGAIGVYFTWRNLSQTRQSTERTLWLTEQGQITERFTRAIDQLGATGDDREPMVEIRLGGIYALERLAKDSPDRDYSTVMEVLTTYARENAPYSDEPQKLTSTQKHSAAIRAIVAVIRRLHGEYGVPEKYRIRLDLHYTYLREADLSGAHLSAAHLSAAHLIRAYLRGAYLRRAYELTQEQLKQTIGDEATELPEGRTMPASWATSTEEQKDEDK